MRKNEIILKAYLQRLNNTHTCICLLYTHSYICVYKYALKCHMAYVEIYAATCYCRKHTHTYVYAFKSWHVCVKSASKVLSTSILSAKTNSTSLWRPKWKWKTSVVRVRAWNAIKNNTSCIYVYRNMWVYVYFVCVCCYDKWWRSRVRRERPAGEVLL